MSMPSPAHVHRAQHLPVAVSQPHGRLGTEKVAIRRSRLVGDDHRNPVMVQVADEETIRDAACSLINRRYAWRGYGDNFQLPRRPTNTTFTASDENGVIGTITLAFDSDHGLAAERTFGTEIAQFRKVPGAKLCELTKLAFDSGMPSKPLLASLFHIVFIYGHRRFGGTDLFIEVNPRHRRFYETMLGFTAIGDVVANDEVQAPAQLMWLDIGMIRDRIDQDVGSAPKGHDRSLYPLFFAPHDELGIYHRLAPQDASDRIDMSGVRLFVPTV